MAETQATIRLSIYPPNVSSQEHSSLRDAIDAARQGDRTRLEDGSGRLVGYIVPAEQGEFLDQFEKGQAVAVDLNMNPTAPGPDWREGWQEAPVAEPKLNMAALSVLLARLTELSGITPRVLGVPDGTDSLPERIDRMLRDG